MPGAADANESGTMCSSSSGTKKYQRACRATGREPRDMPAGTGRLSASLRGQEMLKVKRFDTRGVWPAPVAQGRAT
jgi:hypothetical protein